MKQNIKEQLKAEHQKGYIDGIIDGIQSSSKNIKKEIIQEVQNGTIKIDTGTERLFAIIDRFVDFANDKEK